MNGTLNINLDSTVVFTNKLEKLHKSALPVAIRTALNSAAFDVKQNTMLKSADKTFENRSANFFKANSRVEMATGFNMNHMRATVGFVSNNLKGENNFAVKDLEQQEHGGAIAGKSLIPLEPARVGKSYVKAVRPMNRVTKINRVVNVNKVQGLSSKQRFVKAAIKAGTGGYVLGNFLGDQILYRIDSLIINRLSNKVDIKKTPLYDFKSGRKVKVKATGFMEEASLKSGAKIEDYYIKAAEKQIERLR